MNINFPSVDDRYIKAKVKSGFYANATELIRDAVRRMREQDEQRDHLVRALQAGESDIAAGCYEPYGEEMLGKILTNARQKAAKRRKPKSDVTP